jgi:hypothetical protein
VYGNSDKNLLDLMLSDQDKHHNTQNLDENLVKHGQVEPYPIAYNYSYPMIEIHTDHTKKRYEEFSKNVTFYF